MQPAHGSAAQLCRSFPAPRGALMLIVRQACRPLRRTKSSSARDDSARETHAGVEPASRRRRERIPWRHVTAGMLVGLDASALLVKGGSHASNEPRGKRRIGTWRIRRSERNAGPTLSMIVRDQLATGSKPASSENMLAEGAALEDPPKDAADPARTHKPTTKQPFENLLSEKKRAVNLFLRSLLLG